MLCASQVKSLSPPRVYLCRTWYARVCNTPFDGAPLSDLSAHLTVQKYDGVEQEFVNEQELVRRLQVEAAASPGNRPRLDWEGTVKPRVLSALARTLKLLMARGERSVWADGRCRALYGFDVIFADSPGWQQQQQQQQQQQPLAEVAAAADQPQPVVLEVNYSPDYAKQLEFAPCFLDSAFALLFLEADGQADGQAAEWEALPM